jgi:hypothetical protein
MSEPNASPIPETPPSKKATSPARNLIGLILLVVITGVAWSQFAAVRGYNAAVKALEVRTQDEEKSLLTADEVEKLIGRTPDGPESVEKDTVRTLVTRKYTWRAPIRSYKLTAHYSKEADLRLINFETEGAQKDENAK